VRRLPYLKHNFSETHVVTSCTCDACCKVMTPTPSGYFVCLACDSPLYNVNRGLGRWYYERLSRKANRSRRTAQGGA
jgi:hypothetical protein